jgi:hypothetical protein
MINSGPPRLDPGRPRWEALLSQATWGATMMGRRTPLAVIIGVVALAVPSTASAEAVSDATCPGPHTAVTPGTDKRLAQTFTVLNTGTLTSASVVVDKFAGGNGWTFSINAVASGVPTDVALTSTAVPESSIPPNDVSTVSVSFAPPLPVEAGQQYALVVARAAGQMGVGSRSGDVCPGALFESSSGGPFAPVGTGTLDMVFTVFVEPTPPQPESQPAAGRTITLDANKNKVKKGKRVTLTGQLNQLARQEACESGQTVQLQRKKPSQATFTTVEQLQTDAAGRFSAKEKVKKTSEYRAQVAGSATCGAGLSNTEKVKVKKKK